MGRQRLRCRPLDDGQILSARAQEIGHDVVESEKADIRVNQLQRDYGPLLGRQLIAANSEARRIANADVQPIVGIDGKDNIRLASATERDGQGYADRFERVFAIPDVQRNDAPRASDAYGIAAGSADKQVATRAQSIGQIVVAEISLQQIVTAATLEVVVTRATAYEVLSVISVNPVVTGHAVGDIISNVQVEN